MGEEATQPLALEDAENTMEEQKFIPALEQPPALEEAGDPVVDFTYSLYGNDLLEGLKIYDKKVNRKSRIITTLISIFFIFPQIGSYFIKLHEFLFIAWFVFSIFLIAAIWYFPSRNIKKTAKDWEKKPDQQFHVTVYRKCVRITERQGCNIYYFNENIKRTFEAKNLFLLDLGGNRVLIFPKRYFRLDELDTFRELLQIEMGKQHVTLKGAQEVPPCQNPAQ